MAVSDCILIWLHSSRWSRCGGDGQLTTHCSHSNQAWFLWPERSFYFSQLTFSEQLCSKSSGFSWKM